MNRFEQLIEYVINDEEQKARELFHDIVVEKSREIYENLMAEEAEEELDEAEEELDEAAEEELDEAMGGDAADDLIDDVEMDETSDMHMEAEEEEEEFEMSDDEGGSEPATKDDVMDLADKIDELIADFEAKLGDDADMDSMDDMGDDLGPDEGGDALATDDTDEMMPMAEAVSLKAAPAPVKSEEGGINKKAVYASNSGARGAMADPVKMTGDVAQGRPAPTTKELIGKVGNTPAQGTQKPSPATKPHLAQATGVNVKSPLPSGTKG